MKVRLARRSPETFRFANGQLQSSRKRHAPDADYALSPRLDLMARIVAKRLGEHIEQAGFVVVDARSAKRVGRRTPSQSCEASREGDRATE
jgi:hypothetical protein